MPPTLLQRITTAIQNTRRQNQPGVTIADFQSDRFVRLLNLTADERLVFNRLAARLQQIDNFSLPQVNVALSRDGFISASEIEALAGLAGNGNEIEASDLDRFDTLFRQAQQAQQAQLAQPLPQVGAPLQPAPPPQVGPTAFIPPTQVPTAIAQFVPTQSHLLGVSTHRFPNGEVNLGGTGSSGVISLGDNRYARMFWGRDSRLHMLVYTTRPDPANPQGPPLVNDYVREYVVPCQYLQARARERGMHLIMSEGYDRLRNRQPELPAISNEHCLERFILPHLLRDTAGGPINLARLSSSDFSPINGANPGISFREGSLSALNAMRYTPFVPGQQNDNYQNIDTYEGAPSIHNTNIPPPTLAQVTPVNDPALNTAFTNYYTGTHATARLGEGNTVIGRSGLYSLGAPPGTQRNRDITLQAVRVRVGNTEPPQYNYRLLVRYTYTYTNPPTHSFEEINITETVLRRVAGQALENVNFNSPDSVAQFISRRCMYSPNPLQAAIYRQAGYIPLPGLSETQQQRRSDDNANFQTAIDSMVPGDRMQWRNNSQASLHPTGIINITPLTQTPTTVQNYLERQQRLYRLLRYENQLRIGTEHHVANYHPRIEPVTQFTITREDGTQEHRALFLENNGTREGFFTVSWTGDGTDFRYHFSRRDQIRFPGFNLDQITFDNLRRGGNNYANGTIEYQIYQQQLSNLRTAFFGSSLNRAEIQAPDYTQSGGTWTMGAASTRTHRSFQYLTDNVLQGQIDYMRRAITALGGNPDNAPQ